MPGLVWPVGDAVSEGMMESGGWRVGQCCRDVSARSADVFPCALKGFSSCPAMKRIVESHFPTYLDRVSDFEDRRQHSKWFPVLAATLMVCLLLFLCAGYGFGHDLRDHYIAPSVCDPFAFEFSDQLYLGLLRMQIVQLQPMPAWLPT